MLFLYCNLNGFSRYNYEQSVWIKTIFNCQCKNCYYRKNDQINYNYVVMADLNFKLNLVVEICINCK